VHYDLTPLRGMSDLEIPKQSSDNNNFYLSVCAVPSRTCTSEECSTCDVTDPAGVDVWTAPGQRCAAIGEISTAVWHLQQPGVPTSGVAVQYTNGDQEDGYGPHRTAMLVFKCDPSVSGAKGVSATEHPSMNYVITIASAHACPQLPQPLSWGWLFIIVSGVTALMYFGGGTAYNVRVRGEEGLDVIPQWQYWQQLPGLVKDGLSFSWTHGRVIAYNAPRELREWWRGRNTKELTTPIAAATD